MLFSNRHGSGAFKLLYGTVGLALIACWTLWERIYRRKWHDYRSRSWTRVQGQFDEGEVTTMRKARSGTISGYEAWLGYDYFFEGEQVGVYRSPEKIEHEANAVLKKLANKQVVVRVDPRHPKRSFVSDDDLDF